MTSPSYLKWNLTCTKYLQLLLVTWRGRERGGRGEGEGRERGGRGEGEGRERGRGEGEGRGKSEKERIPVVDLCFIINNIFVVLHVKVLGLYWWGVGDVHARDGWSESCTRVPLP